MKTLKILAVPLVVSIFMLFVSAKDDDKQIERINSSSSVLKDFCKMKESIPHELMDQAQGVVIIPKMINAGFVVGGKHGNGVAMVKHENGEWSDPVFITLTGGSVGFQAGVQSVDLILVFKHKGVLAKVEKGDFTIGGDISAAAGPVGRSSSANTDYKLEAEVYSYSRSRGLFGGVSINGTNLGIDKNANKSFYGSSVSSEAIFETAKSDSPVVKTLKANLAAL